MSDPPALARAPARPVDRRADPPRGPGVVVAWCVLSVELLILLAIQWPTVADFRKFAFYDQGAWLHLDALWAAGRTPTEDLGYSYGMLALIVSRQWLELLGRTPWAFIGFVTLCNLVAAMGVAGILRALGLTWPRLLLAGALLPHAIFPFSYSLMHALEMVLILLALGQLARERYGLALALAVLAVFTKPSMAYVLGFLLLCLALWRRYGWRPLVLPTITALGVWGLSIHFLGWNPAWRNILPLTGGRSYQLMHFGFFQAGREFWWPSAGGPWAWLRQYLLNPTGFWMLASLVLWLVSLASLWRLARRRARDFDPLLATMALLHGAFVFFFYAWADSWTYYGYLPVLGLLVILAVHPVRPWVVAALTVVSLAGYAQPLGYGIGSWLWWQRGPETASLWTYKEFREDFLEARAAVQTAGAADSGQALYLVNGALPVMFEDIQTPACWFLSPGIPTAAEITAVKDQMAQARVIVLFREYNQNQEAWWWPEFAAERMAFSRTLHENGHFRVIGRAP